MVDFPLHRYLVFTVFILFLNACTVGPNYTKPSVEIPSHYKEAPKGWKVATPQDEQDRGEWWKIFHDSELNSLEAQLNVANQNVIAAEANYRKACWLVKQARSNYFPTISGLSSLFYEKRTPGFSQPVESLLLNPSWEPDLWGKVRRLVESSTAEAEANSAQLAAIKLSSQASLAQFYLEMRTLDRLQIVLNSMVSSYQKSLQIAKQGYSSGHSARTDLIQAENQLESAKAQALHNGINRAKYEHAIAILIGKLPENLAIKPNPLIKPPPTIPSQIPSALLERRPDIAKVEREMAQANAQIGLAIAAYFPNLRLAANGGYLTNGYSPMQISPVRNFAFASVPVLYAPAKSWGIGATLTETLLDGGYRRATTQAARANYDNAVAHYRQTILSAFQEVEDDLVSLRILKQEAMNRVRAEKNARLSLKLIMAGYKSGMNSYTDVIIAQNNLYQAAKDNADVNGLRMAAAVGLIKALGGGWNGFQCCQPKKKIISKSIDKK